VGLWGPPAYTLYRIRPNIHIKSHTRSTAWRHCCRLARHWPPTETSHARRRRRCNRLSTSPLPCRTQSTSRCSLMDLGCQRRVCRSGCPRRNFREEELESRFRFIRLIIQIPRYEPFRVVRRNGRGVIPPPNDGSLISEPAPTVTYEVAE
jgi:hypothetical protein